MGAVTGPVLGGLLTSIDWRLIFYINVPIAALAILVGRARIPDWLNARSPLAGRLNFANATVLGVAIALVMLWLTLLDVRLAALGGIGVAAFAVTEVKSKNPVLNRSLLHNRGFVFSVAGLGIMMVSFFGLTFLLSFYFQSVAGFSPLTAGIWLAPLPALLGITNPLAGRLYDKLRLPALLPISGGVLFVVCVALLSVVLGTPTPGSFLPVLLAVMGFAGGLVWSPSLSAALQFSKPEMRGVANGTAFTLIYVGFATGVALVISVSTAALPVALAAQIRSGSLTGLSAASALLFDQGLVTALIALGVVGLVGLPFLLLVLREQRRMTGRHGEETATPGRVDPDRELTLDNA